MNRALKLVSTFAFALVAACSPGNSEITVNGQTLTPKSAEFWSGPISTELPIPFTMVMVHDVEGLCETFGTADACSGSIDPSRLTSGDVTMLTIAKIGGGEGESTVSAQGGLSAAMLQFVAMRGGKQVVVDQAVSGTISFDDFEEGEGASGSYEVTMESGAKIEGTFDADFCDGIGKLIRSSSSGRTNCDQSSSSDLECSNSCTCEAKKNTVNCTRTEVNQAWTCTCNSRGETSTCTVESNVPSFAACSMPQGCCPDPEDF